jgi:hypothetical protein
MYADIGHAATRLHGRVGSIVKRGAWSVSPIFGRCMCGHTTIYGICHTCGGARVCAWCNRIKLPDGRYGPVDYAPSKKDSHGICKDCLKKQTEGIAEIRL